MNKLFKHLSKGEKQQLLFMKYLKMYLESHFSFNESIKFMQLIWPKKSLGWFLSLTHHLKNDSNIYQVLLNANFSRLMSFQIQAALQQGTLVQCLKQLITLIELQDRQTKKIKNQLSYPLLIFGISFLGFFFIQQTLNAGFLESKTSILEAIIINIIVVFVGIVLVVLGYLVYVQKTQKVVHLRYVMKWPVIGKVLQLYIHYLITFNLSYWIANGYSFQTICQFFSQNDHSLQSNIAKKLDLHLNKGLSLKGFIAQEDCLPNRLIPIIESGKNNQLKSQQIKTLNQIIYEELLSKLRKITLKIQPICFILLALFILGLYLKILMPLYGMLREL